MNKYGIAAADAAKNVAKSGSSPEDAWNSTTRRLFPGKPDAQNKLCPKAAFLGLCEKGIVLGVPEGSYTNSFQNKAYAVRALEYIRRTGKVNITEQELWKIIEPNKTHNYQMSVVLALVRNNLIEL